MARGLAAVLEPEDLTVVVNIGDDDSMYGVHVSPDLDTVLYTLAGIEGPHGWGLRDDTFAVMDRLSDLGTDTAFRLGDRDLATCLQRTNALAAGERLSAFTGRLAGVLGVDVTLLPATDDSIRTQICIADGSWLAFQDYFVIRRHRDRVRELRYAGADRARPAPRVVEAISAADVVIIAPSNPPLSIWPILAVTEIADAVTAKDHVAVVSPLFGGEALKGPAASVMADLGLPPGNMGVAAAYAGLFSHLFIDQDDAEDVAILTSPGFWVHATDTRIGDAAAAARFSNEVLAIIDTAPATAPVR